MVSIYRSKYLAKSGYLLKDVAEVGGSIVKQVDHDALDTGSDYDLQSDPLIGGFHNATPIVVTNYFIHLLNNIQEGTDIWQRVGRQVFLKSLHMDLYWSGVVKPSDSTVPICLRTIVVYDFQPNSSTFTWSDLIQSYDGAGNAHNFPTSQLNPNNQSRFKVLHDKILQVPGAGTAASVGLYDASVVESERHHMRINLQLNDICSRYSSSGSTIASITSGALFVLCCPVGDNVVSFQVRGSARLRFVDGKY